MGEHPSIESVTHVQHYNKTHQPDLKWIPMMMTNKLKFDLFLSRLDSV